MRNSRHTLAFILLSLVTCACVGCGGALAGGTINTKPPERIALRAVAVVVTDPEHRPIQGAACGLDGGSDQAHISNADGYVLFAAVPASLRDTQLTCQADGYQH